MSFLRHGEIYPPMRARSLPTAPPTHRLDEFPAGYSLAGCSPAEPASASPADAHSEVQSYRRSSVFHRTATSVLTGCLTPGGRLTWRRSNGSRILGGVLLQSKKNLPEHHPQAGLREKLVGAISLAFVRHAFASFHPRATIKSKRQSPTVWGS